MATYGDVAARAGSASPRLAGFVLSQLADEDTPWHRVLRANGTPAAHLAAEQIRRLRAENVEVIDGRVDLKNVPLARLTLGHRHPASAQRLRRPS